MLIELNGAYLTYMTGTLFQAVALEDVSLSLDVGASIGIVGPTGSGKSSLGQVLAGLIRPDSGQLSIDGKKVKDELSESQLYKYVGFLFQKPEKQLFEENVYDEVAFGPRNLGLSKEKIDQTVKKALSIVGLDFDTYKKRLPFDLSGGEMRRVGIASILSLESRAYIMDEPTAGLDAQGRQKIIEFLKELKEDKRSLILISHDLDEVLQICDNLIVLEKGRIILETATVDILNHAPLLHKLGLNLPERYVLASALKECGWPVKGFGKKEIFAQIEEKISG